MLFRLFIRYPILILLILITTAANAQLASQSNLFIDHQPLEITLEMDIKSVISDIVEREYRPAIFTYKDQSGNEQVMDIKVRTRGQTRSLTNICKFPPLMLNFKKQRVANTIFAGQDKLKIVTHCGSSVSNERYVLQEFLIYKHYNLLTERSFRARLIKVTYKDTTGKQKLFTEYGFMIEDKDLMAERNGMVSFKKELYHQDFCDKPSLDLMVVFQYMIGNTDWHVPNMHNLKFIAIDTLRPPIPVPYDFDFSGAIFTNYATPHESIPVKEVRSRFFQGFCRPKGVYEHVFKLFNERKEAIYDVYRNSALLSEKRVNDILKYFDKFYDIINNPKMVQKKIISACRVKHVHFKY